MVAGATLDKRASGFAWNPATMERGMTVSVGDIQVSVAVDESVTDEEAGDLEQIFQEYGIQPKIETTNDSSESQNAASGQSKRNAFRTDTTGGFSFQGAWTVLIFTPVNDLANKLGPLALKELIGKLWSTRGTQTGARGNAGLVMLVDEETGIRIALERDLPDDAYDVLRDIDMRAFRADPLKFFRDRGRHGRWRSPDNVSGTG